jgi:hypothetical protein
MSTQVGAIRSPNTVQQQPNTVSGMTVKGEADGVHVTIEGQPSGYAARMKAAAAQADGTLPASKERVDAFKAQVLPVLTDKSAEILGDRKLADHIQKLVSRVADALPTDGMKDGKIDVNYPPRAANKYAETVLRSAGCSNSTISATFDFIQQLSKIPHEEGRYGPTLEQVKATLGGKAEQMVTDAVASLMTGNPKVTNIKDEKVKAFALLMLVNNFTWHVTNFQRGAGEDGKNNNRTDPGARDGVFNTYSDNLQIQYAGHGLKGAAYMVLMDAYNAGKLIQPQGWLKSS